MGFPKVVFRIVENRSCPLYQYGDVFELSGIAIPISNDSENSFITTSIIKYPLAKKVCKILNGDLSKIVMLYERGDKIPVCMISCGGCTGSIKLEHSKDDLLKNGDSTLADELGSMMHLLSSFSFFKNIEEKHLNTVISYFKLIKFDTGNIVIRKGDPGGRFYIIVTGSVNVLNDAGIIISTLDKGEVFGEMSLICNDNVNATIQVKEPSSILYIDQPNFQKILDIYPAIQLYFSRLMAERLNRSNRIRAEDLSSGMTGNLSEIPAEALFQTLNMNNKTGILTITDLSKGTARFSFRQGSLIKAKYNEYSGDLAFYQILKEKSGRFRFTPGIAPEDFSTPEIGFFMKLLMEGMRRLDEGKPQKTN
ncbi:MAG: Crp/Fnr family transcriptional regulator [Desulfobulbaceae bacterium BRH_c16a]|nr:MAG: Crp/Fnr family transcriptional regulator [Desulfobulbaceae bacterium BRH_c16a]